MSKDLPSDYASSHLGHWQTPDMLVSWKISKKIHVLEKETIQPGLEPACVV